MGDATLDGEEDGTVEGPNRNKVGEVEGSESVLDVIRAGNLRAFLLFFLGASTVDMLVGETGLLTSPKEFIIQVVIDWLYTDFIRPVAVSLWDGGVAVIDGLSLAFFGNDYAIGHPGTTQVGILDVPFLVTGPVGGGYIALGESISAGIESINQPFVDGMAQFGIAAPIVAQVLIVAEIAGALWAVWVIVSAIDVPAVRVVAATKAALRPLTNLIRWLLSS